LIRINIGSSGGYCERSFDELCALATLKLRIIGLQVRALPGAKQVYKLIG